RCAADRRRGHRPQGAGALQGRVQELHGRRAMSDPERKMIEDRALRDAARALVKGDIAHLRVDLTTKGIGARFLDRVAEGASDVLYAAEELSEIIRGYLSTLLKAVVPWLTRNPLLALFGDDDDEDQESEEPERD